MLASIIFSLTAQHYDETCSTCCPSVCCDVILKAESQPVVQSIEVTEGAVQDAASFNSRLAEIRRNFRSNYVDHQTNVSEAAVALAD